MSASEHATPREQAGDPPAGGPARTPSREPFSAIQRHGFVRVALGVPQVRVADPAFNARRTIGLARQAAAEGAALVAFPELGLSAYTGEDLFHQDALLDAVGEALALLIRESASLAPLLIVGAPLVAEQRLYNCALAIQGGRVLGAVPKSHLPNYREFYEKRQFRAARDAVAQTIPLAGAEIPFGPGLVFCADGLPGLAVGIEVCEDLWAPIPPSSYTAMAGATVLVNLSASNITVGKADYRRLLCASQSGRAIAAYLYVAAGSGESTTDLAWDGQALVYENGELIAAGERFAAGEQLLTADIDLDRIAQDRLRITSFSDCARDHRERVASVRRVPFAWAAAGGPVELRRELERFPYVPHERAVRDARCREVYSIQVGGLITRLRAAGIEKVVIGVSGGLDSTHALLVAVRAIDQLGLPRSNVLAYTMPGFATSALTLGNARRLMAALGVSAGEIDIRPSAELMLRDIGHPAAEGQPHYDITYENVQAGERTSHLFRLANRHGALVLGTGDLSELALGWATYGVGDHMSHYSVNASVPKTLISFLIRWVADSGELGQEVGAVLRSVLDTAISPELVPHAPAAAPAGAAGGAVDAGPAREGLAREGPADESERVVGPYELQDFFLYYTLRFGYRPSKVAFLALHAWGDARRGTWPELIPEEKRNEYSLAEIRRWLEVFLVRFFATSQFKRSAIPNAPKVGSGGSLSPRGDWRAPSDGSAQAWLRELRAHVPDAEARDDAPLAASIADAASTPGDEARAPNGRGEGGSVSDPAPPAGRTRA
jgi:NAD+ synthase (glutamine-hydrolysing)